MLILLSLGTLLQLGFLEDTTQLDLLIPRLRAALLNSTGGSGKASDVNFAQLQAELDQISRENVLRFSLPPFFTVIIRSLTILEGVALSVDPNFRLVRGAYPYVLRQLLNPEENEGTPEALTQLLIRLLTVNGEGKLMSLDEKLVASSTQQELIFVISFFLYRKRNRLGAPSRLTQARSKGVPEVRSIRRRA